MPARAPDVLPPLTQRPLAGPQPIGARPPLELGPTPVLVVDTAVVAASYRRLAAALPGVHLHYAVKANPAAAVLRVLAAAGARWDVASLGELRAVLAVDPEPAHASYGNPIKKAADVAASYALGARRFVVDSAAELAKVVHHAPGATVLVRLVTSGVGADWALGGKFGCEEATAAALLRAAAAAGHPAGVAFHVGTQQRDPGAWEEPLAATARLRAGLRRAGADLAVVDIGGGFPAALLGTTPTWEEYGAAIIASLERYLGPDRPEVMAEPGRALVADAGWLWTEVVLVADRSDGRWVYLDAGVFTGLVEAFGEGIRYRLRAYRDGVPLGGSTGAVVLAGPTCDSLDVLFGSHRYALPLDLRAGDRLRLDATGAYTATYSTVGFNGFAPLREVYR
jgi:ornithine decarboxylase